MALKLTCLCRTSIRLWKKDLCTPCFVWPSVTDARKIQPRMSGVFAYLTGAARLQCFAVSYVVIKLETVI